MSDKDYLDWYKNDLDLEARIEQKLKALEKKLITAQEKIIDFEKGEKLLVSDIYNSKKEIAELKDAVGILMANSIGKLNHKGYMDYRKKLSAKDDPYRMCPKCGTCMIVDIATLNKIDWYCPKCAPTIEEWQYTGITLEGKKELIAELIEDFDELIAWTNTFPYSETYIRLKRKREKWEAKLQ